MTPFFLIDFENVQPKALERLRPGTARIKVFLGQNQSKLGLELVQALQPFGADGEYIQITGSGPDAVDFHIAFYIGRLASANPGAAFTIISKDKGFDPLVKHLATLGIECSRVPEIPVLAESRRDPAPPAPTQAKAPQEAAKPPVVRKTPPAVVKPSSATTARARAKAVIERLKKSTKPATPATLRSSIRSYFSPPLDDKAVEAIVQSLTDSGKIKVAANKVTYALG